MQRWIWTLAALVGIAALGSTTAEAQNFHRGIYGYRSYHPRSFNAGWHPRSLYGYYGPIGYGACHAAPPLSVAPVQVNNVVILVPY
jgi:hypothetical protein